MVERASSCVVRFCAALLVFAIASVLVAGKQQSTPEDLAFEAVRIATNAASSIAAAEAFVSTFPQSSKRVLAARLVAEQLRTIRNPSIGITLVERARTIFTAPDELNFLQPIAVEIYANGNRVDEAFAVGASLLSSRPNEFSTLSRLTYLGADEARKKNLKHIDLSVQYGQRAIEIIENNQRPTGQSDQSWNDQKAALPGLYQQMGILRLAEGKASEAKASIVKETQLDPRNPVGFALLARILNKEYLDVATAYEQTPEGPTKRDMQVKRNSLLDQLIDAYARATGLATGKREYIGLLQQLIPDLTTYYKARHNDTAGLQQLIEKYR